MEIFFAKIQKSDLQQPLKFKQFLTSFALFFSNFDSIFLPPIIIIDFGRLNLAKKQKFIKNACQSSIHNILFININYI